MRSQARRQNRSTVQIQEELSDNDEGADDWVANPSKPIYPMQSKFYDVSLGSPLLVTPVTDNLTSAIGSSNNYEVYRSSFGNMEDVDSHILSYSL
jgi:hypothetical protein